MILHRDLLLIQTSLNETSRFVETSLNETSRFVETSLNETSRSVETSLNEPSHLSKRHSMRRHVLSNVRSPFVEGGLEMCQCQFVIQKIFFFFVPNFSPEQFNADYDSLLVHSRGRCYKKLLVKSHTQIIDNF